MNPAHGNNRDCEGTGCSRSCFLELSRSGGGVRGFHDHHLSVKPCCGAELGLSLVGLIQREEDFAEVVMRFREAGQEPERCFVFLPAFLERALHEEKVPEIVPACCLRRSVPVRPRVVDLYPERYLEIVKRIRVTGPQGESRPVLRGRFRGPAEPEERIADILVGDRIQGIEQCRGAVLSERLSASPLIGI